MKLELKHIAPYLPYSLHCKCMGEESISYEVVGTLGHDYINVSMINSVISDEIPFEDCFPVLRPLSDLTKEITHNGEKFVPIEEIAKGDDDYFVRNGHLMRELYEYHEETLTPMTSKDILGMPYWIIKMLLEWNFDIYGLIESNLAIAKT